MNLYEVYLKGNLKYFNPAYVVSISMDEAYETVLKYLQEHDYGFISDRGLHSIKIIAQDSIYSDHNMLFVGEKNEKI